MKWILGSERTSQSAISALEKQADASKPELYGKFVKGDVIHTEPIAQQSEASNPEAMEIDEEPDSEEIDISEKNVPEAVFGGLKRKAENTKDRHKTKKT